MHKKEMMTDPTNAMIAKLNSQWLRGEDLVLLPEEYDLARKAVIEWNELMGAKPWVDGKIYFRANHEPIGSPLRLVTVVGVLDYQI